MSNYIYNDEFDGISGTIDGADFDPHFAAIETAIASKADIAGPVTHTGAHTFDNATLTLGSIGALTVTGSLNATAVATSAFAGITGTTGVFTGALSGLTLAGSADTTDINGGTWA